MDRIKRPYLYELKHGIAAYNFYSINNFITDLEDRDCFDQGRQGILFFSEHLVTIRSKLTEEEISNLEPRLQDRDEFELETFPDIVILEDEPMRQLLINSRGHNNQLPIKTDLTSLLTSMTYPKYKGWDLDRLIKQTQTEDGLTLRPIIQYLPFEYEFRLTGYHDDKLEVKELPQGPVLTRGF